MYSLVDEKKLERYRHNRPMPHCHNCFTDCVLTNRPPFSRETDYSHHKFVLFGFSTLVVQRNKMTSKTAIEDLVLRVQHQEYQIETEDNRNHLQLQIQKAAKISYYTYTHWKTSTSEIISTNNVDSMCTKII